MTDMTNPEQIDARIKREAEIAETARQKRAADAKAKREAAKPKPVAKQQGSMAEFVDNLLLQGISMDDLVAKAKAEADRRKVGTLATKGALRAHVNFRSKQKQWKVTDAKGTVKMVAVTKPAPKAKPTGKPTGRKVTEEFDDTRR
jgi:hypothetical protein